MRVQVRSGRGLDLPLHEKLVERQASRVGEAALGDVSFIDTQASQKSRRLQYEGSILPSGEQEHERGWSALLEKDPLFALEPNALTEAPVQEVVSASAEPVPTALVPARHEQLPPALGPTHFAGHFESSVGALVEAFDQTSLWASAGNELRARANHEGAAPMTPVVVDTPVEPPADTPAQTEAVTPIREGASRNRLARAQRREKKRLNVSLAKPGSPAPSQTASPAETETMQAEDEPEVPLARELPRPRTGRLVVGASALLIGLLSWVAFSQRDSNTERSERAATEQVPSSMSSAVPAVTTNQPTPRQGDTATSSATPLATPPAIRYPASNGLLWVQAPSPGRVFVQGIDAGPTGAFLEVSCGLRNVRVAKASPPPPGQSFPDWLGDAESVVIPCGSAHRVELPRARTQ